MKNCKITFLLGLFSVLMLTACAGSGSGAYRLLRCADTLLDVRPDSALRLLQEIPLRQLAGKDERMYYALLFMQAKYKNNFPMVEDDSLLCEVAAYYADAGQDGMQARACYLLGNVYTERQEADRAFLAYHEAARRARRAEDGRMLCLVLNQWAHFCQRHGMVARGDSLYAETARLARQVGDSVRWAEALLRRGAYALSLGDSARARAEWWIRQGYGLARRLRSAQLFQLACFTQSVLYSNTGRMTQALAEAGEYLKNVRADSAGLARGCLLLGNIYFQIHQKDSAQAYLCRAMWTDDYAVKESACISLARIAEAEGDYERMAGWERKRLECRDRRQAWEQTVQLAVAAKEVELMQALRARDSRIFLLSGGLVVLALLLGGCGVTVWMVWRKRPRAQSQADAEETATGPCGWDYFAFRQQMYETDSWRLIEFILNYYKEFADYQHHWGVDDRNAFFRAADGSLPGHRMALGERFPQLTQNEVFCCYLYILGLSDEQVGVLLERDRSTAYRRRKAMMKKMGLADSGIDGLMEACHIAPEGR